METVPHKRGQPPSKPSRLATIATTGGVVILAVLTLSMARQRLQQMRVETAFIDRAVEPIVATDWGTLEQVYVREGERVSAGTPLVRVERDLEIQEEIARLEGLILAQNRERFRLLEQQIGLEREQQQARADLDAASAAIALEEKQIPARAAIERSRVEAARAEVASLGEQLAVARTRRDRFRSLSDYGAISQVAYDETVAEVARLQGALSTARENLTIAQAVLDGTQRGDFIERDRLQGQLPSLRLQQEQARERQQGVAQQARSLSELLASLEAELTELQARRDRLRDRRDLDPDLATVYTAPVSGVVANVLRSPGNSVSRGASLVVLEHQRDRPEVAVYLTQEQAQQLAVEQPARVYDPISGEEYLAQMEAIDWTGGRVDEVVDPLAPVSTFPAPAANHPGVQRSVLLRLTVEQDNLDIPNGSPVVVTLDKHQNLLQRTARLFEQRNRIETQNAERRTESITRF